MRAKFRVASVEPFTSGTGENIVFQAVAKSTAYPEDGSDEDNTFAKYTPNADLRITVMNPALIGQFQVDQTWYADFTRAD